jgi:hypothetical protein
MSANQIAPKRILIVQHLTGGLASVRGLTLVGIAAPQKG